jgi:nitrate reductase gamma subunit
MTDLFLFVVFPYVAIVLAVVVGVYRYFHDRFSYSSFSSQFLENKLMFWGSVPWHYGIVLILLAHLLAALFPRAWGVLLGAPVRLYVLEITGMALGLMTVVGAAVFFWRRLTNPWVKTSTSVPDGLLLVTLLVQVILGLWVAFFYRWGGVWYLHTAAPWLASLATFRPDPSTIAALPVVPKLHILGGILLVAIFPFTRLVHLVTYPITYLWRPYQVVIWNRRNG